MLLRASGRTYDKTYDLAAVTGALAGDGGVPEGDHLVAFAEAVIGEDDGGIPLEPEKAAASADFRVALDLDRLAIVDRI